MWTGEFVRLKTIHRIQYIAGYWQKPGSYSPKGVSFLNWTLSYKWHTVVILRSSLPNTVPMNGYFNSFHVVFDINYYFISFTNLYYLISFKKCSVSLWWKESTCMLGPGNILFTDNIALSTPSARIHWQVDVMWLVALGVHTWQALKKH